MARVRRPPLLGLPRAVRRLKLQRYGPLGIALSAGLFAGVTSLGLEFDHGLQIWRNGLHVRSATGHVAFVDIDARSLAAFRNWPWPRGRYAEAIQALQRAGAQTIAFDIDFSAPSLPDQDDALAKAIAASDVPVVLPTFRQAATQQGAAVFENLPIPALRAHAELAAVNIYADHDGLIRSYPYGAVTAGLARPSIGSLLAGTSGTAGTGFPIDGSIDLKTIPQLSFVDLLSGHFTPGMLRGRHVLIGASAIELGDRYPIAGHGIVPGPMIQILAAETLLQNSAPIDRGWIVPLMLALAILAEAARRTSARRSLPLLAGGMVVLFFPLASEMAKLGTFDVLPAGAALLSGVVAEAILTSVRAAREARQFDADTGLPNGKSLQLQLAVHPGATVVVLRLANYGDVAAVLGNGRLAEFVGRVASRLAFAGDTPVHRIDETALGWLTFAGDEEEQSQRIDAAAAMLRAPFDVGGRRIELVHAFGLAADTGPDTLLKARNAADRAVSRSSRWARYTADMEKESEWRLALAGEMDAAMAAGDIWVAYQPKFDLRARRITAAEALVRWRHIERGAIPPDSFIPALEDGGRIGDLTLFVLERALTDRSAWAAMGVELDVAVNLSAVLPADPRFIQQLEQLLARHGESIAHLTLEVTESAAMVDPELAIQALDHLASLGVSLSIDDYGTGQSTLSYLKRLPAREIKIDKSFIQTLETSRSDQLMVQSTIALAHELGFKVVAEGVETAAVMKMLTDYGCDTAQGWHIGRPVVATEVVALTEQSFAATG
jgi:EAL domain-containing protein (putative c-di-GMP-specific phosphodiesterase class I)/CHASE2 domain-containing sensor protein/alkylated DNA nucleotide flippase Atl1